MTWRTTKAANIESLLPYAERRVRDLQLGLVWDGNGLNTSRLRLTNWSNVLAMKCCLGITRLMKSFC